MAYVPVPNDLSRIKTKLAFNLTKRQLICFSIAGGIGVPFYLFTRSHIGNSTALFLMIGLMMPCFLFAMFEKDGLPFEKVLRNIIRTRFLLPRVRPYKTENFYAAWSGPGASGQVGPRPEDTPKGGTRIAKRKRGKTGRAQAGGR